MGLESESASSRRRLDIGAKWRISAAAAAVGLLLCGSFGFAVHKHGESVRADAQAARARADATAAERAVSTFWQEREALGEVLAFPHRDLTDELRDTQFRFHRALEGIATQSAAEVNLKQRAGNANENLLALFDRQTERPASIAEELRTASELHIAEQAVIEPVEKLRTANRRENLRGQRIARSAERATFHTQIATAGFGLAAVALFALFAVRQVRRIDDQNLALQASDAAKDEFISTVSHELRTPMTSINGYVELLLDQGEGADPLTGEQRSFLTTVQRGSSRLENLISNAIKFTPESGNVDVTLAQGAGRMTLNVADTGMGMTSSDIDHLFERFFRTDSAQAKQIQGTGLGLPIVKAIVQAHDGTISVTSEPHVGSSFVVSKPLAHPVAA